MELWVDYFGWLVFQANDGISLGFILIDSVNLVGVFRAFTKEFFKSFY